MISFFSTVATIVISLLIIISLFNPLRVEEDKNNINKIVLVLLLILFVFSRLYKLTSIPSGINVDEAGMMYDAYCLSQYGVDRYLNSYPVYFSNFGGGQSIAYGYWVMLITNVFNKDSVGILIARLPQFGGSSILFISSYLIFKERFNKKISLLGLLLVIICPYFIMSSRWGLDSSLMLPMLTLSSYLLILSIKGKKNSLFILTGIIIGLTLYTYALSYIIIPIFLLLSLSYFIKNKKIDLINLISLGLPIFVLALPLILMLMVNNNFLNEFKLFGLFTITKIVDYRGGEISLLNIINNLYLFKLLLVNDYFNFSVNPLFGTIYIFNIPLLIVGFIINIKNILRSKKNVDIVVLFMFLSVLACSLMISEPNISKSNGIYFTFVYFIIVCIENMSYKKIYSWVIIINIIGFSLFSYSYYFKENTEYTFFEKDITNVVKYLDRYYPEGNVYLDVSNIEGGSIYVLLAESQDPNEYLNPAEEMKGKSGRYYFGFNGNLNSYEYYVMKDDNLNQAVLKELEKAQFKYELSFGYRIYNR
jgi:hypothetical protein